MVALRGRVKKKVILVVVDGFGYTRSKKNNPINSSTMPFYHSLLKKYPHTLLNASGVAVGLPKNTMGNSEVGHINLGAGRVVHQDCVRINQSISKGNFFKNKTLVEVFSGAKKVAKSVHVLGLLSISNVHAHIDHLFALIKIAKRMRVKTFLHLFTDGRDMDPFSSIGLIKKLDGVLKGNEYVEVATVSGRYYGMDRDKRWRRTKLAYDAITFGKGKKFSSVLEAVKSSHADGVSDEFVKPCVINGYRGINNHDFVFSFNFRSDRARQICYAFKRKNFVKFKCSSKKVTLSTMTLYDPKQLVCPIAFSENRVKNCLVEVLSNFGVRQFHVAETEKYAHVTYFFNGGVEKKFKLEERVLIPSLKVSTYDKAPLMRCREITKECVKAAHSGKYGFVLVNFANCDMVAHSGDIVATKKALRRVDNSLKKLVKAGLDNGFVVLITSDHGNCERMHKGVSTSHTTSKVRLVGVGLSGSLASGGALCNVAPSILKIMGLRKPREMSAKSLV